MFRVEVQDNGVWLAIGVCTNLEAAKDMALNWVKEQFRDKTRIIPWRE